MNNSVMIKSEAEIELMRESGKLLAQVFAALDTFVKPGVSTMEINDFVEKYIVEELQARPASKGQYDYQYVLNSSINEVVCHGIPKTTEILKPKDIINLDITLEKSGFITDSSKMYVMPEASKKAIKLVKKTYQAMWEGIKQVKPGAKLGDVAVPFNVLQNPMATAWYASTVGMALDERCTKSRKCCTTVNQTEA